MNSADSRRESGVRPSDGEERSGGEGDCFPPCAGSEAEREAELLMASTEENLRFASELMDNIGQLILLARIKLDTLAGGSVPDGYTSVLDRVRVLLDRAVTEIRSLLSQLTPPLLAELGLEYSLKHLCRQLESDSGLQVKFADDGSEKPLTDLSRSILYHAARETLSRVVNEGRTGAVQLSICRTGAMLQLVVEDREGGEGYAERVLSHRKTGGGTICHCIRHLGGDIRFMSLPGRRAGISIRVPLAIPRGVRGDGDGG